MTTTPERLQRRRGATLLVSIAILTLLAVFSIAFINLVNFERVASANYVDGVRARMIARAGIERAIAEMKQTAVTRHYSDPTNDRWLYTYQAPAAPGGRPTSLLTTTRPSLAMDPFGTTTNLAQRLTNQDSVTDLFGEDLICSGVMSTGTYGPGSVDAYKLKILDAASQINVNHPDRDAAARLIKNLLRRTSELHGRWSPINENVARGHAIAVLDKRPNGGFGSVNEVWQVLAGRGVPPDVWLTPSGSGPMATPPLREMITVHSYVDPSVIRPWHVVKEYAFATSSTDPAAIRDLSLMGRSPVNLNTASRPVLAAVLAELEGKGQFGRYRLGYGTPSGGAVQLAELIFDQTHLTSGTDTVCRPFRTWLEFERWLDGSGWNPFVGGAPIDASVCAPTQSSTTTPSVRNNSHFMGYAQRTTGPGTYQGIRDLVKAMLNPNTMVNKFGLMANHGGSIVNNDIPLVRLIDKSDITHMTTEGCFDSCGVYDITSLGLVLVKNEREPTSPGLMVLAAQTIQSVVRIYDVVRLTTQSDFETHRALFTPGDFITAFDRDWDYDRIESVPPPNGTWCPGVNKPAFGPAGSDGPFTTDCTCPASPGGGPRAAHGHGFEGWPGVTSFPTYSLERSPSAEGWSMGSEYSAAAWDGHLTLSNLQLQQVWPQDFVAGFARGSLKAFKCRVWWEPKDQEKYFIPTPGQVWNGNPRKGSPGLEFRPSRGHDRSPIDPDAWGPLSPVPHDPDGDGLAYSDVTKLCPPVAASLPRTVGRGDTTVGVLGAPNPLDAVPGKAVTPANNPKADWFFAGSALTPNGILIDPRRRGTDDPDGNPNTDDANPGYFTFDGDNLDLFQGSSVRFWVMPTADPGISDEEILFSWVGNQTGTNRHVGFVVKKVYSPGSRQVAIHLEAHCHDDSGSLAGSPSAFNEVSINVTRRTGSPSPNPAQPEWIVGQWMWIVLNFGAYKTTPASALDHKATLQVNLATQSMSMNRDSIGGYGEIHGNVGGDSPLTGENINRRGVRAGIQQKTLGDWYHCCLGTSLEEREDFRRWLDVLTWNPGQGNSGGRYDRNTNWPANPFPTDSYDRRMTLEFREKPVPTPPAPLNNPSRTGPMSAQGNGQWRYTFSPEDLGPDKAGGTSDDYQVDVLAQWKIRIPGASGACSCCSGPGTQCRTHCTNAYEYHGFPLFSFSGNKCLRDWTSATYHAGVLNSPAASPPPPDPSPVHGTCDQCNGCEACDIDAPMFFGGEPAAPPGGNNKNGATVTLVDPATMAHAMFDNLIIKNNKERRSDVPNSRPEDRFYQDTLVQATTGDTGAVYRRGFLEIAGVRGRLGTLTWTSYPTTPINGVSMDFTADLFCLPGGTKTGPKSGEPTFRFSNATMLTDPVPGSFDGGNLTDPSTAVGQKQLDMQKRVVWDQPVPPASPNPPNKVIGYNFANFRTVDTNIDPDWQSGASSDRKPYPKDLLVLQVALRNRLTSPTGSRTTAGIPTPILESPVLEDVTLTFVRETVQILRAEEGVEE